MNQRLGLEHNKMNVGKLLRLYRQHAKYKSEYVANELAISIGTYSKMENGVIELTDSRLFSICKISASLLLNFTCILNIDLSK
ncbi:MAG: hypothetical protein JWQ09_5737 [Segetibacter sp.]|nr:hypothetical protein [Segetibacter sp.]